MTGQAGDAGRWFHDLVARGVLEADCAPPTPLAGGTDARVWLVRKDGRPRYVLKAHRPEQVVAETLFLEAHRQVPLLPRPLHTDSRHLFYVYSYLPGSPMGARPSKGQFLETLAGEVIARWAPAARCCGWGYVNGRSWPDWRGFIGEQVRSARGRLMTHLPAADLDLAEALAALPFPGAGPHDEPRLLHGDLGVHNLLFEDGRLTGIIDPDPVVGPPLYDLLFAFCSSPDDLEIGVMEPVARLLPGGSPLRARCGRPCWWCCICVWVPACATIPTTCPPIWRPGTGSGRRRRRPDGLPAEEARNKPAPAWA